MKLSIITINYNDAKGLQKTIESVVNQSFTDYEHIIIDGGSNDGSVEVIKQYEDKISYWVSEPDRGVYNAMNKGILKANGEYLHFLNSGDWLAGIDVYNNIFNELVEYDVIYGNAILEFDNNKKHLHKHHYFNRDFKLSKFLKGNIIHQCTFINKKLFKQYGCYDEHLKIVSDWKFFIIAICLNNAVTKYKNITVCHFDMQGISNKSNELKQKEMNIVINELIPEPIQNDYRKIEIEKDKIDFIKKYKLTKFLHKLTEAILIRMASKLRKINKF